MYSRQILNLRFERAGVVPHYLTLDAPIAAGDYLDWTRGAYSDEGDNWIPIHPESPLIGTTRRQLPEQNRVLKKETEVCSQC